VITAIASSNIYIETREFDVPRKMQMIVQDDAAEEDQRIKLKNNNGDKWKEKDGRRNGR